ncbi:MAG: hypothetical protein ACK5MN_02830 [Lachnospiraceae bacterium]
MNVSKNKKFGIAEKIKLDEYEQFVESTAKEVKQMRLHKKGIVPYIERVYQENITGLCRGVPRLRFVLETLQRMEQRNH